MDFKYLATVLLGVVWYYACTTHSKSNRIQPIGPRLCGEICRKRAECFSYFYGTSHLVCHLSGQRSNGVLPEKGTYWFKVAKIHNGKSAGERNELNKGNQCSERKDCRPDRCLKRGSYPLMRLYYKDAELRKGRPTIPVAFIAVMTKLAKETYAVGNYTTMTYEVTCQGTNVMLRVPKCHPKGTQRAVKTMDAAIVVTVLCDTKPTDRVNRSKLYIECQKKVQRFELKYQLEMRRLAYKTIFCFEFGYSCSLMFGSKPVDCFQYLSPRIQNNLSMFVPYTRVRCNEGYLGK